LVAAVNNGQIYTSTDSGTNWIARESSRNWSSVVSSADGSKLVAGVALGQIYTSTDGGTNWTLRESNRNWSSVASSADGSKLVAGVFDGQIYTSVPTLAGAQGSTIELQYAGNGVWQPLDGLDGVNISSGTLSDARLSANFAFLNGNQTFSGQNMFNSSVGINGQLSVTTITPGSSLTIAGDAELGTSSGDYRRLRVGGGNSDGFLYGAYNKWSDGIHLGYNYYADAAGGDHFIHSGATSRLSVGYGSIVLATGGVGVAPTTERLVVDTSAVTVFGTFNNFSDRNSKQDFSPVSPSQILDKVTQLPLSEWGYRVDAATRHLGPMAQDFYSAFNIGTDDKHIAPIDEGGIALAAIQGLNLKLTEELKRRDVENAGLKQRIETLERIMRNQR